MKTVWCVWFWLRGEKAMRPEPAVCWTKKDAMQFVRDMGRELIAHKMAKIEVRPDGESFVELGKKL
jgi:uncharacterized protein YfaT (DUF1175 family)